MYMHIYTEGISVIGSYESEVARFVHLCFCFIFKHTTKMVHILLPADFLPNSDLIGMLDYVVF